MAARAVQLRPFGGSESNPNRVAEPVPQDADADTGGGSSSGDGPERLQVMQPNRTEPLRDCVRNALRHYLHNMAGHDINGLYRLVLAEVERPMVETVLEYTNGNQSMAAEILGISRGTLRKKLREGQSGAG
jgi:Fis family transcriptional regulator